MDNFNFKRRDLGRRREADKSAAAMSATLKLQPEGDTFVGGANVGQRISTARKVSSISHAFDF